MIKSRRVTAKQFYSSIKDKTKYKLINDLFIVKYEGNGIYRYYGEYAKKGSVRATPKTAYVTITKYAGKQQPQLFVPKQRSMTTSLGVWTRMTIGFRIKPLATILK